LLYGGWSLEVEKSCIECLSRLSLNEDHELSLQCYTATASCSVDSFSITKELSCKNRS